MAIDTNDGIFAAIGAAITAIIIKMWDKFFPSKKEMVSTIQTEVKTQVLSDAEQREKDKFLEEQLSHLEERYKEMQTENISLRQLIK